MTVWFDRISYEYPACKFKLGNDSWITNDWNALIEMRIEIFIFSPSLSRRRLELDELIRRHHLRVKSFRNEHKDWGIKSGGEIEREKERKMPSRRSTNELQRTSPLDRECFDVTTLPRRRLIPIYQPTQLHHPNPFHLPLSRSPRSPRKKNDSIPGPDDRFTRRGVSLPRNVYNDDEDDDKGTMTEENPRRDSVEKLVGRRGICRDNRSN